MTEVRDMSKLIEAAKKMGITEEELRAFLPLMLEVQDEKNKSKGKAKGGDIGKQMEMFQDGGLKDEGGTKDPISGNDVPPGATQEEVRDDIPAQLSEGEFVFPADVVRYIGLEKLMAMRQEAKMGLKMMEKMGQMGNSEEATIPDDVPFSIIDIEIAEDDDEKEDKDKTIKANTGTYVPPAIAEPAQSFRYTPTSNQPKEKGRATFASLMGDIGGPDEYRTFINDEGVEIQVPFKNGELFTGFTVPEGFYPKKEEEVETKKVSSAKVKSTLDDSDGGEDRSLTEQGYREGANVTFMGGRNVNGKRVGSRDIGVIVDIPGGITKLGGITGAIMRGVTGNYPKGTRMGISLKGDPETIRYVTPEKYKELINDPRKGDDFLNNMIKSKSIEDDVKSISKDTRIDEKLTKDQDFMKGLDAIPTGIREEAFTSPTVESGPTVPSDAPDLTTQAGRDSTYASQEQQDDSDYESGFGSEVDDSGYGQSAGSFGGIGDFKQGGLAKKKKKTKVKKKKRSGLASKK
ncbi:hypothetical protein [Hyphomonas sp.]|uniref:hypothetical protein n=1 Tax=Hyphomonas sp. TaxID=87 RepID=UPI000C977750|nr:hypothetical protein [Hyphomonas sp.]MAL46678.1 hypothetical protein [Hyphomonas sp.]